MPSFSSSSDLASHGLPPKFVPPVSRESAHSSRPVSSCCLFDTRKDARVPTVESASRLLSRDPLSAPPIPPETLLNTSFRSHRLRLPLSFRGDLTRPEPSDSAHQVVQLFHRITNPCDPSKIPTHTMSISTDFAALYQRTTVEGRNKQGMGLHR